MKTLVKVWPLRSGIQGCDALGAPVVLTPGLAGWMFSEEAQKANDAGEVQIMAGLRPKDLKPPQQSVAASMRAEEPPAEKPATTKKRAYRRRDMQAEKPSASE